MNRSIRTTIYAILLLSFMQLNTQFPLLTPLSAADTNNVPAEHIISTTNGDTQDNHTNHDEHYFIRTEEKEEERLEERHLLPTLFTSIYVLSHRIFISTQKTSAKICRRPIHEHLISWRSRTIDLIVIQV